ncbi:MAG: 50S ribosomal protein L17 [Caldilineales bacterium]|nr:50S ribosomal protein L17 [Caldilineales bacterium]
MRHHVRGRHLGRSTGHRQALFKNLITELFRHGQIETTEAKAKAIRADAEKLITIAKRGRAGRISEVHARRLIRARLNDPELVAVVYDQFAERYADRPGGYTRIFKLGPRKGDGAEMALIELVE